MDRWIERNLAERLIPLAQMLAEKKLKHPPDSLELVRESMDRLQARGPLKEIPGIDYLHAKLNFAPPILAAPVDQQIGNLQNLLRKQVLGG